MKREIVTPYLVFVFLIVAFSGTLMFFHLFDDYTNVVHEFLGLTFAFFAVLHIINNWKSIVNYSKKRLLAVPSIVVLLISVALIIGGILHGNIERRMLEKLAASPACFSFTVLNGNYSQAKNILANNRIFVKDSLESIEQISARTSTSPEEIVGMIMK